MRNQYPGTCYRCGGHVEAGAGHFEKVSRSQIKKWGEGFWGTWLVQHADCAIRYRGTAVHYRLNPGEPCREEMDDD